MRDNIKQVGAYEKAFLPFMDAYCTRRRRTAQEGGYVTAIRHLLL